MAMKEIGYRSRKHRPLVGGKMKHFLDGGSATCVESYRIHRKELARQSWRDLSKKKITTMNSKMTINLHLSPTEPKRTKTKTN